MFALIVKNASLPDGRTGFDIACRGEMIEAVEPAISAQAKEVVDAQGYLVSPPFVDPHFHMDATLSLGRPRMNVSGTLLEGIALWGELKQLQSIEEIVERALRYCELAVAKGIGAIRSHVDVCDDALTGVQALLEVREKVQDYLDLQLVAFPTEDLNLHIFEPRYRQMMRECEEQGTTFGIPAYLNKREQEYGTELKLMEIVKRYPDG